ncbi:hypothetical protein ABEB36_004063 [Hypothenemus hampei]|uniref:BHLH domain-containing protein n=1 Tax=Hypothenemus hampei TaxID=57062 RepID=A0ABD1F231_HYPHA
MSQISVVQYNASVAAQKLNILQQNTSTNHGNSSSDRHIIVLRKPPPILPQPKDYSKDDILITNPGRKGYKKAKEVKTSPQPMAVARRNARERNRVKQVNNGFANLRQHIPNFIAQAFESSNGRGNKKLSKVETLRMAVEYIRSLEEVLALDGYTLPKIESGNISNTSPNSQSDSQNDLSYSFVMSPSDDDDDFSSVATPSPQQYIRINTTNNTYEILPSTIYENSENLDPMSVEDHQLNLLDSNLDLSSQDLSYLQVNTLQTTTGSLSPGMYSEGSLSPSTDASSKLSERGLPQNCFIPVFSTGRLGENFNVEVKTELNDLAGIALKVEEQQEFQETSNIRNWWEQETAGAGES